MPSKKRFLEQYNGQKLTWWQDGKRLLLLALLLILALRFVVGFSVVSGHSMMDTLQSGDIVIYTRVGNDVQVGDVVSLSLPSGEYYVKRVAAMGGDVVDIRDGMLYVNGVPENGAYVRGSTLPEAGSVEYPFTVPQDNVFTLGDNREDSIDSRFYGPVNLHQVQGVLRVHIGRFFVRFL